MIEKYLSKFSKEDKGVYIEVSFDEETSEKLDELQRLLGLEVTSDFHTTLIYSRKGDLPDIYDIEYLYGSEIYGDKIERWNTPDGDVIVLKLESYKSPLQTAFQELSEKHEYTFDYDEYTPYITLATNVHPDEKVNLGLRVPHFYGIIKTISVSQLDTNQE